MIDDLLPRLWVRHAVVLSYLVFVTVGAIVAGVVQEVA